MYELGYIGNFETLPEVAVAICDRDTARIEALITEGLDINASVPVGNYSRLKPLEIATVRDDVLMIRYLLERGADPNIAEAGPLLVTAAHCCGPEGVEIFIGQANKMTLVQKQRVFYFACLDESLSKLEVLERAGITATKFGGEVLRKAIGDENLELAEKMLKLGADINYHKPDMVYPWAPTPVSVATRYCDDAIVRWLIERGADITIPDKDGARPYTIALQLKKKELAEYLKSLEPEDWHNEQEIIRKLKPYKLPEAMITYLKTGPLHLEFPTGKYTKWAELFPYMDLQEMKWQRKKYLSLLREMENYGDYYLLWNPSDKKLWSLDVEHEVFQPLCDWESFIENPGRYLNGMIDGEFEEKIESSVQLDKTQQMRTGKE